MVSEPGAEATPISVCATSALSRVPSEPNVRAARSPCGTESDCRVEKHLERAASAKMRAGKLRSREVKRRARGHTAVMDLGSEPRTDVSEERLAFGTKPGCEPAGERSFHTCFLCSGVFTAPKDVKKRAPS